MSDDSDNDEGFVPNKIQIKEDIEPKKKKSPKKNQRPVDFQARYIFGDGIYRYYISYLSKQPSEAYTRFAQYLSYEKNNEKEEKKKIYRQQIAHPYEKYLANQSYALIYARYRDRISLKPENDDFTSNAIPLDKICGIYEKDQYSLLKNFQSPQTDFEGNDIVIDSRFQCGNLLYAFKNKNLPNEFTLFVQNDTNTNGYNQWFNFSVKNAKPGVTYKFSIVNFKKKHSFFKENMKISVFSLIDAKKNNGNGWRKMGTNVKYERSPIRKYFDKKFKFYSLSFELQFQHQNDYLQIAMSMPYSYSRLIHNLKKCEQLAKKSQKLYWQMNPISHSLSNNGIPYITLTSHEGQYSKKKVILILARQHPGETWASFLMEEIIYTLVEKSEDEDISTILENYIFKIFPMINVDGVIYGNSRCDIGGFDMNRNWKNPSKILHPQIVSIKEEIIKLSLQYDIQVAFDLHGHSKQYNVFCYSCKNDPVSCRTLPFIMNEVNNRFHFPYCTFGISKYKETTARAVIYQIIQKQNVLTIENSLYGSRIDGVVEPFQPIFFRDFSLDFLKAVKIYLLNEKQTKQVQKSIKRNLPEYLSYERKGADSGSDSDPEGDEIAFKQKVGSILPKTFVNMQLEKEQEKEKKRKATHKVTEKKIKPGRVVRNYQTLTEKPRASYIKKQVEEENSKTFIQRTSLTYYKRNSKQVPKQTQQRFGLQKKKEEKQKSNSESFNPILTKANDISLPFYLRDKPQLIPIKLKNDSLQIFKDAYNATKIDEEKDQKNGLKGSSTKKVKILKESEGQEFPWLCVFSENKKKNHLEKIKNALDTKKQFSDNFNQTKMKTLRSEKLQAIRKKQEKKEKIDFNTEKSSESKNAEIISKVWRQNICRYGKELNILYGGIKK